MMQISLDQTMNAVNLIAAVIGVALLGGRTHEVANELRQTGPRDELDSFDSPRTSAQVAPNSDETLVCLSLSRGGTRAAALLARLTTSRNVC